ACNRTHRRGTDTIFLCGLLRGFDNLGMIRQSEIIIRAEVEHALTIHDDARALCRTNCADAVVQALFFQAINFLCEPIKFGHGDSCVFPSLRARATASGEAISTPSRRLLRRLSPPRNDKDILFSL